MDIYERVARHSRNVSEDCKGLAEVLNQIIQDGACDKDRLLAIVLSNEISSAKELLDFLRERAVHIDIRAYGKTPEESPFHDPLSLEAYMLRMGKYNEMITAICDSVKNVA